METFLFRAAHRLPDGNTNLARAPIWVLQPECGSLVPRGLAKSPVTCQETFMPTRPPAILNWLVLISSAI